jgi:hypothetical protein
MENVPASGAPTLAHFTEAWLEVGNLTFWTFFLVGDSTRVGNLILNHELPVSNGYIVDYFELLITLYIWDVVDKIHVEACEICLC